MRERKDGTNSNGIHKFTVRTNKQNNRRNLFERELDQKRTAKIIQTLGNHLKRSEAVYVCVYVAYMAFLSVCVMSVSGKDSIDSSSNCCMRISCDKRDRFI